MSEKNRQDPQSVPSDEHTVQGELSDDELAEVAAGTMRSGALPLELTAVTSAVTAASAAVKLKTIIDGTATVDGTATTFSNETFEIDTTPKG